MAATPKLRITLESNKLRWTNRVSGAFLFEFPLDAVHTSLREAVFAYGVKQIIADGGAKTGIPGMAARADSLVDGTWGQRSAGLVNGDTFRALVGLGLIPDSSDARAKWRELKPAQRDAFGRRPDVRQWIDANAETDESTDDLLAGLAE